jgi:hypothetical protein
MTIRELYELLDLLMDQGEQDQEVVLTLRLGYDGDDPQLKETKIETILCIPGNTRQDTRYGMCGRLP